MLSHMGQLIYGSEIQAEIDDRSLFHLDVLIARLKGTGFQLHFVPGGKDDGRLVSISITPGTPLGLIYGNFPDLSLDLDVVRAAELRAAQGSFVTIPFRFES